MFHKIFHKKTKEIDLVDVFFSLMLLSEYSFVVPTVIVWMTPATSLQKHLLVNFHISEKKVILKWIIQYANISGPGIASLVNTVEDNIIKKVVLHQTVFQIYAQRGMSIFADTSTASTSASLALVAPSSMTSSRTKVTYKCSKTNKLSYP